MFRIASCVTFYHPTIESASPNCLNTAWLIWQFRTVLGTNWLFMALLHDIDSGVFIFSKKKGNTTANFVQFKTMATIITYPSALEYWLSEAGIPYHFHFDKYSSGISNKEILHSTSSRKEIFRSIDWLSFSSPVHVAVSSPIRRTSTQKAVFHKQTLRLKVLDMIHFYSRFAK